MNTCANETCTTNILDTVKYCGKCHAQAKKAQKKAARKRKNRTRHSHNPYDMKHRLDKSGHIKAGMGLAYLKQLDRQRWEQRQFKIAQALEKWGWAILKMADKARHEQLQAKRAA